MTKLPYNFKVEEIIKEGRTTPNNIAHIKEWLSLVEDGIIPDLQDELIVIFLLSCENNLPLTKNTIKMYYQCKRQSPDIFNNRDISQSDLVKALKTVHMCSIPVRTDENYAIHYFKLNDTNYANFDLVPIMKLTYMLLDITQEKSLPNGLVVVMDFKGASLMHLSRMNLSAIKRYFLFLQEGFPLQMKVIHLINAVYFMDKLMSIIKVFMKTELLNMIKIHPPNIKQEKLFSLVPRKCLPEDYGGDLPSAATLHERTIQQLTEKQEFWRIEELLRK